MVIGRRRSPENASRPCLGVHWTSHDSTSARAASRAGPVAADVPIFSKRLFADESSNHTRAVPAFFPLPEHALRT